MTKAGIMTKELERLIRKNIFEVFSEILSDPDFGLEMRKSFFKKLKKSMAQKKKKLYSLEDLEI